MNKLPIDVPIQTQNDDLLDRKTSATEFAKSLFSIDYRQGLVVGIFGEWGSGKTSYINLMKDELNNNAQTVFEFNPWLFNDTHNLINIFFIELSIKLRINNNELADRLQKYGEWITHIEKLATTSMEPHTAVFAKIVKWFTNWYSKFIKIEGIEAYKQKIIEELEKLEKPIVVIIDDIDRLSSKEIEEIFKLVRLTASFPNIIYILALDRVRVEQALSEQSRIDGAAYLEKIIQVPFNLPLISNEILHQQFFNALDNALKQYSITEIDINRWGYIFNDIIKPNLKNMRDVRRYILAVTSTLNEIKSSIQLVDILALETIRLFYPKKFEQIYRLREVLTTVKHSPMDKINEEHRNLIINFLEDNQQFESLIENVFPAAEQYLSSRKQYAYDFLSTWKKDCRMAHIYFLDLYFNKLESKDLILHNQANQLFTVMDNIEEFSKRLNLLPKQNIQTILNNLIEYEDKFNYKHATNIIPYLFELQPHIPEKERTSFWDITNVKFTISTLVYRLIRAVDEQDRLKLVNQLIEQTNLTGQLEIIEIIGYREGRGHKLLPKIDVQNLQNQLSNNILSASIEQLENCNNLIWLFYFLKEQNVALPSEILQSEKIALTLFKSAKTEMISQHGDEVILRKEERLFWDTLEKIYSDENTLYEMIDRLNNNVEYQNEPILKLANKYRTGWRPRDNDD